MSDSEIARMLGFSPGYFSKIYAQARKLMRKHTGNVSSQVQSEHHIPRPATPSIQPSSSLRIKLHRFQRTYAIENAVSEDRLKALKLNDRLNNIKEYLGAGFRLIQGLSWTLEIEGLQIISDFRTPPAVIEAQALLLADNIAKGLAKQYGFIIDPNGETPYKLTEYEMNATQMTEKLKKIQKKSVLELYKDSEGYSIWVDWSFGEGGMETNKVLYMQRLADLAKDLAVKDGWEQSKEIQLQHSKDIGEIKSALAQASGLIAYYATNMESHAKLVRQAASLIREIRKERKTEKQAWVNARQRRLS